MTDQPHQQAEGVEDIARESTNLRWEGHRMQGINISLNLRFDDTIRTLESRSDKEARAATLRLAKEFKRLNGVLAGMLGQMSMINRTLVEMLQKSEDGEAALIMRKAAELLVKGLANAEEEVHSLRTTVSHVERQRDHYKALLAKTNSELKASDAYAQMNKAIGERAGAAAAAGDDAGINISSQNGGGGKSGGAKGKGKRPARQAHAQQHMSDEAGARTTAGDGSFSDDGSGGDSPPAAAAAGKLAKRSSENSKRRAAAEAGRGAPIALPGTASNGKNPRQDAPRTASMGDNLCDAAAPALAKATPKKRPRDTAATLGGRDSVHRRDLPGGVDTKEVTGREERQGGSGGDAPSSAGADGVNRHGRPPDDRESGASGGRGKGSGKMAGESSGQGGAEVSQAQAEAGARAGKSFGGIGDGGGGDKSGDGWDALGGDGDVQSVCGSDDAPSMFF